MAVGPWTKIINSFYREGEWKDVDKYDGDILLMITTCVSTGLNIIVANNFVLFDLL
jgi:hypothetical protein